MKHLSKFLSDAVEIGAILMVALSELIIGISIGLITVLAIFGSLGGGGDSDGDY